MNNHKNILNTKTTKYNNVKNNVTKYQKREIISQKSKKKI
jgi:hypothetical protein